MRSTADLIRELDDEAKHFRLLALAVGFEKSTECIWSTDEKKLEKLNELVKKGGEPVGLVGVIIESGIAMIHTRPLEECKAEAWVQDYLSSIVRDVGELAIARGFAKSFSKTSGWVN